MCSGRIKSSENRGMGPCACQMICNPISSRKMWVNRTWPFLQRRRTELSVWRVTTELPLPEESTVITTAVSNSTQMWSDYCTAKRSPCRGKEILHKKWKLHRGAWRSQPEAPHRGALTRPPPPPITCTSFEKEPSVLIFTHRSSAGRQDTLLDLRNLWIGSGIGMKWTCG